MQKPPSEPNISIRELSTGYLWGGYDGHRIAVGDGHGRRQEIHLHTQRGVVSYVTGSHAFKVGGTMSEGWSNLRGNVGKPGDWWEGLAFTFQNGSPQSLTQWQTPTEVFTRTRNFGLFAQEQWTLERLTLNLGVRYDHFWAYTLPVTVPAGPFIGERSYPRQDDVPNFQDITPRLGAAYDLFGNGKTAIKGAWGRYVISLGGTQAATFAPASSVQRSTTRLWTDANRNFMPDCVLTNFAANGECGAIQQPQFGERIPSIVWADSAREGWGKRQYNYQYMAALQHELRPGLGTTVSYHRTVWKGHLVTVNQALTPADFNEFCIAAPTDPRLGRVSGQRVCGLYDVAPAKFGQVRAEQMLAKDVPGATAEPEEIFNGVDVAMNARFGGGAVLTGGITIGRTVIDDCWRNDLPQVEQTTAAVNMIPRTDGFCRVEPAWWDGIGTTVKFQAVYPLPYDFVVSGTFKHLPGIPVTATHNYTNAEARASLGRDLSACRGAVNCTQRGQVQLLPNLSGGANAASKFDERLTQVDTRLSRRFRVAGWRFDGFVEFYNVFNARPPQAIATTYGPAWMLPASIVGGRLFKFGAQIDY